MDNLQKFYKVISETMQLILDEEAVNIDKAAEAISQSLRDPDQLLHIFGTGGHSIMAAEELFFRAGGLVQVDPIFFSGVSQINGGMKTGVERVPGLASIIMQPHKVRAGEVMIIASQVGVNSLTIEAAEESKRKGLVVVGIESRQICDALPADCVSRHHSGKNLHDIADITIDVKIPYGDGVIEIEGVDQKTGPVSNILIFFALQSVVIRTVEKLAAAGVCPPIWKSLNVPGGDEVKARYLEKYVPMVKAL